MSRPIRLAATRAVRALPVSGDDGARVAFGDAGIDVRLGGGLVRASLHEFFACDADDSTAVSGFAALLAQRSALAGKSVLWLSTASARPLYAPGLAELGADPASVTLVQASDVKVMLGAAGEVVKCGAVGALVIEGWEKPAAYDLTVTRRLALAAARSGVFALLLRHGPDPPPSAARTRWRIASAPSAALLGNAPGTPAFDLELFRHRGGVPGFSVRLEWNRDTGCFVRVEPLSGRAPPAHAFGADQDAHARAA